MSRVKRDGDGEFVTGPMSVDCFMAAGIAVERCGCGCGEVKIWGLDGNKIARTLISVNPGDFLRIMSTALGADPVSFVHGVARRH